MQRKLSIYPPIFFKFEQCLFVHVKGIKIKIDPFERDNKESVRKRKGEFRKERSSKLIEDKSNFLDVLLDIKTTIRETMDIKLNNMTRRTNPQQFPPEITMPWLGMQPMQLLSQQKVNNVSLFNVKSPIHSRWFKGKGSAIYSINRNMARRPRG